MPASADDITLLRWETLSKKKFDQLDIENCVVLVTCSPLEVHGPHLPLGADLLEGNGLSVRAIQHLPEPHRSRTFLQLPFIYTACDPVPQKGSIYFSPSTTITVLTELGRSLAAQGFRDIVVSNFHGSPRHFLAIEEACTTVSAEAGIRMIPVFSIMLGLLTDGTSELYEVLGKLEGAEPEDYKGDTHAGIVETSQLLALHPEWVERDYTELPRRTVDIWLEEKGEPRPAAKRGLPGEDSGLLGTLQALPTMVNAFSAGLRFFREETYSGTPGKASAELGEKILDELGSRTAAAMVEILEGRMPPEKWHSPLWDKRFFFTNPAMVSIFNRLLEIPKGVG